MSNTTDAAQKAVMAINVVGAVPGASNATKLIALHQIERHLQGLIRKVQEDDGRATGQNPVNQGDHE